MFQPSWVTEQCLAVGSFNCCGDEDLFPFKCATCITPFVICGECDTFYPNLHDLTQRIVPDFVRFACPSCDLIFVDTLRDPAFRSSFDQWHSSGLGHLISVPSRDAFIRMLIASCDQMIDFLSRGMQSTARQRSANFRNFAESIAAPLNPHSAHHGIAFSHCDGLTLKQSTQWLATLDPVDRSFATLGVLDRFIPEVRGG